MIKEVIVQDFDLTTDENVRKIQNLVHIQREGLVSELRLWK
jgi:hypothetical protein